MCRRREERLAWLTGFTGSAGVAIVLMRARGALRRRPLHAAGARSGRYRRCSPRAPGRDAAGQLDREPISPPARASATTRGCTPSTAPRSSPRPATAAGATLVPVEPNPIDAIWTDRPAPPLGPVTLHDLRFAGEAAADKLARVRAEIAQAQGRRAGRVRPARRRLDLQYPRRRRGAHAAAALLRHRAARRPPRALCRRPQAFERRARRVSRSSPTCASPPSSRDGLTALGAAKRPCGSIQASAADAIARLVDGRRRQGRRAAPIRSR